MHAKMFLNWSMHAWGKIKGKIHFICELFFVCSVSMLYNFFFLGKIIYKTGIHMWNCLCYKFNWILRKEWKPQQKWFLFRVFFLPFHFMGPTKFHTIINIFAYFCYKCSNAYNVVLYMFMLDIQQKKKRKEILNGCQGKNIFRYMCMLLWQKWDDLNRKWI